MTIGPSLQEKISRARTDLRMGVPIVLNAKKSAFVIPAETLSDDRLKDLRQINPDVLLVLTSKRANTLKLAAYDGDLVRVIVPNNEGSDWVKAVSDPSSDLETPIKGPFKYQRGGNVILERFALTLIKSTRLLPSALIIYPNMPIGSSILKDLTVLNVEESNPYLSEATQLSDVIAANLPTTTLEKGKLHVFRPDNGAEEHYAMEFGKPPRSNPVLVRIHSACFTGDVLGSLKCDCGPQLRGALEQIGKIGTGVLLYLNEEGRGIGLANKMRAYSLQSQGYDTVEANHRLGFEDDERDFRIAASILQKMGIKNISLLTNNPNKILMMEKNNIIVHNRVPLISGQNPTNASYLATKAKKSGHLL